ncbi:MAG TPA: restriction endonuclease [Steroidobacteraceae bacterium]|nr:restriction endonuclease [Steroidobacteraceae bacterium]
MFEDLILLAAEIPWPWGVAMAVASFLMLHSFAGRFGFIARLFELIIPPALLLGAGVSAWRRSRASQLFNDAAAGGIARIREMSWPAFEQLVGEAFRRRGFSVAENITGGADGGIDLVLTKGTALHLVQCKQWRAGSVPVSVVRELKGVMAVRGATGGVVVTSGKFTPEAVAFAARADIELLDGQRLAAMIPNPGEIAAAPQTDLEAPSCPSCDGEMVMRTARRGANAGKQFWGCKAFPRCTGTKAA